MGGQWRGLTIGMLRLSWVGLNINQLYWTNQLSATVKEAAGKKDGRWEYWVVSSLLFEEKEAW